MANGPQRETIGETCPYCGATPLHRLYANVHDRLNVVPGNWSFYACGRCSSARLFPQPSPELLLQAYPPDYCFAAEASDVARPSVFVRLQRVCLYGPLYRAQMRRIVARLPKTSDRRQNLLDVGCGKATRLRAFADWGFNVHGLDMAQENVDYVNWHLKIPAVCGNAENVGSYYAPRHFDVITAFALIEHLRDPGSFLKQCEILLKPGGALVLMVPLVDSIQAAVFRSRWLAVTEAPRHVTLPSRAGLRSLLSDCGYRNVQIHPDSTLNCAGIVGLTLFPGASNAFRRRRGHAFHRVLSITASVMAVPFCLVESYAFQRPANAVIIASTLRKSSD